MAGIVVSDIGFCKVLVAIVKQRLRVFKLHRRVLFHDNTDQTHAGLLAAGNQSLPCIVSVSCFAADDTLIGICAVD